MSDKPEPTQSMTTRPKPFCFVLMPFKEEFNDIYELGIKKACEQAGAYCERVDKQNFTGTILQRIYNQIAKADFIVADVTGQNANVFYEIGYAHALGKETVLLARTVDDIPFDLKHFPHIVYKGQIKDILLPELTKRIRWCVENPTKDGQAGKIDLDVYVNRQDISSNDLVVASPKASTWFSCMIHNGSGRTFAPGDLTVSLITPEDYLRFAPSEDLNETRIVPPTGQYLYTLTNLVRTNLFSDQFLDFAFTFMESPTSPEVTLTMRIFTHAGNRDYPFRIRWE